MRSSAMLGSARSSSKTGACPHHSDRRWPRINALSARRRVYSNRDDEGQTTDDERPLPRLTLLSSVVGGPFSVIPLTSPEHGRRNSVDASYPSSVVRRLSSDSHMPDFVRHLVERRVPIDLRRRRLEHQARVGRVGGGDGGRGNDPDRK